MLNYIQKYILNMSMKFYERILVTNKHFGHIISEIGILNSPISNINNFLMKFLHLVSNNYQITLKSLLTLKKFIKQNIIP